MTKKQREQVVELLRCAADNVVLRHAMPFTTAADDLGVWSSPVKVLAKDAFNESPFIDLGVEAWHQRFLEAAARVEEGSWP